MAARTDETKVRATIDTDDSVDVTQFITDASLIVDELCVPAGYSDERLELIERYLAAHLYRMDKDVFTVERQVGSGRWRKDQFKFGEGLKMTRPGQQVLFFDTAKTLTRTVPVGVDWMGTPQCDKRRWPWA